MHKLSRLLIHLVAFVLLVLIARSDLNSATLVYIQSVASLLIYLWIALSWRSATGRLIDVYFLFATAVFLFNAGQTLLYCFGGMDSLLDGKFSDATLIDTLTVVNCYLVAMHAGASVIARTRTEGRSSPPASSMLALRQKCATRVGWVFLAIAFPFALIQLGNAVSAVYTQGYFAGLYQHDENVGAEATSMILAEFLVPAALFILAGARRTSRTRWVALSLLAVYVLIEFFLGRRSSAIVAASGAAWLWNRTIKKLPVGLTLLAVVPLAILLPIIGQTRNTPGEDRLNAVSFEDGYRQLGSNPIFELIHEMGNSMAVDAYILELIPDTRPFDEGMSYVYGASTIVPNIFWQGIHPGAANAPSKWLIETVDPATAEKGGGMGFSVFAEAYMNFGLFGGAIVIMLIGAGIAMVSAWASGASEPGRNALAAATLCFILFYARAEFGAIFRGLTWYAGVPYGLYNFMLFSAQRRATPSVAPRRWTRRLAQSQAIHTEG